MSGEVTLRVRPRDMALLKEALGYGMLNLGLFVEGKAKANFQDIGGPLPRPPSAPGEGPVVQTGNLRRSIHTVAFADGRRIGSSEGDLPAELGDLRGIGVVVGTNTGYGLFLELGTVKMQARPFLTPAAVEGLQQAIPLITAGARRRFPSGPS